MHYGTMVTCHGLACQAAASCATITYWQAYQIIVAADGWRGLLGRGLGTRLLGNGLQSMLFSVVFKALLEERGTDRVANPTPPSMEEEEEEEGHLHLPPPS